MTRSSGAWPAGSRSGRSMPLGQADQRASLDPRSLAPPGQSGDTWDMRARLTSSRFVGRVGELAELELALRDAAEGSPIVVLLGGESGVGKTRLVGELERRLAGSEEPVLVLRGESVEQRDGELPYAPLLSALRPLIRGRHPALERLTAGGRSDLATLLPALR